MEEKLSNYFEQMASQDRISHAFLVCNTEYSVIKEELSFLLNNYFLKKVLILIIVVMWLLLNP